MKHFINQLSALYDISMFEFLMFEKILNLINIIIIIILFLLYYYNIITIILL